MLRIKRRGVVDTCLPKWGDELAKSTDTRDNCGAVRLLVKWLSIQGEQAWRRMVARWIASRLVRGLFIVFPNSETVSGVPSLWRIWRFALQVHSPWLMVVRHGFFTSPCKRATDACGGLLTQSGWLRHLDLWFSVSAQVWRQCLYPYTLQETDTPSSSFTFRAP